PALLNTISASAAASASAATDSAERTSSSAVTTSGRPSMYDERAVEYTFRAPRASSSSTSAAPSPRRPPVTTATLPATATTALLHLDNDVVSQMKPRRCWVTQALVTMA